MNKINTRIVKFKFPRHAYVGHLYHPADFYEPMVTNISLRSLSLQWTSCNFCENAQILQFESLLVSKCEEKKYRNNARKENYAQVKSVHMPIKKAVTDCFFDRWLNLTQQPLVSSDVVNFNHVFSYCSGLKKFIKSNLTITLEF